MKTIIAGTRDIDMRGVLSLLLRDFKAWEITEVVSGNSGNVDFAGEQWAESHGLPLRLFPANWKLGRSAGPRRNRQMAEYADALILIWDGKSRGSFNMLGEATRKGLRIKVFEV